MKLNIKHYFDAAHQLTDSEWLVTKACARLHGHTYKVVINLDDKLNKAGMVIDFRAIKDIVDRFDHRYINDIFKEYSIESQPTAENIAIVIFNWLKEELEISVVSVAVCEGYKGDDKSSFAIYEGE